MGSGVLISAGWYYLADVPASTFDTVTRPFAAEAFATGLPSPADAPGPSALLSFDDGSVWIAGGAGRNQLWRVPADQDGAAVGNAFATLLHPIYALAKDAQVRIWAATGGGPLLQLDPLSGAVLAEHGAGVGLAVAVSPIDGSIVVSAQDGLHRFDPATGDFALISRDRDLRVGSLAFADDGTLWGVTWPDRARVIRLGPDGRAQTVHLSDAPLDSLTFGRKGTVLENLLFVSANAGADTGAGCVSGGGLLLIDPGSGMVARLGRDGTRGDTLAALPDGRMIVSQSGQVDVIMPVFAPEIVATRPADGALAVAPLAFVEVEFDQRLLLSDPSDSRSVLNPANYRLTDSASTSAAPDFVVYFEAERRAFLAFGALGRDTYTLTVSGVANIYNVPLPAPYEVSFEHILDILTLIDLDITQTRLDRDSGQVSFEVQLTNTSNRPIRLPVLLTLDPEGRLGLPDAFDGRADDGRFLIDLTDALPPDGVLQPGHRASRVPSGWCRKTARGSILPWALWATPGRTCRP